VITILVTGAQGFIGRYLVTRLLALPGVDSIIGVGRSPRHDGFFTHEVHWCGHPVLAPMPDALRNPPDEVRTRYFRVDLDDAVGVRALLSDVRPAVIVHLAAALRDEPSRRLFAVNVAAVAHLLEAASQLKPRPRFVLASSGSVYGTVDDATLPLDEDALCSPFDTYSVSKYAGEVVARALARRFVVPLVVARIFNVVGSGLDERHLPARLASQLVPITLGRAPPRIALGPLDTTRDFVDVHDVADGLALLSLAELPHDTFNVASGREVEVSVMTKTMIDLVGLSNDIAIERRPARLADMSRNVASIERLSALGYRPRRALKASLMDMLSYYRREVAHAASQVPVPRGTESARRSENL
jgi:nucleoside-diphosphate-sugar epimerase